MDVRARISKGLHKRLMHYIVSRYGRTYGYISRTVEEALEKYLNEEEAKRGEWRERRESRRERVMEHS